MKHVSTVGVSFVELEHMAGTTALGLLAIKNNFTAFVHLMSLYSDPVHALNVQDLYGNTPLHYFALRGDSARAICSKIEEMGAKPYTNYADETPRTVLDTRTLSCREQDFPIGACFCSRRLIVSVRFYNCV